MNLKNVVLSAALATGACATTQIQLQQQEGVCEMKGPVRECSGLSQEGNSAYYKGTVKGNPVCGARVFKLDYTWYSIGDKGCDGIADAYQEGDKSGITKGPMSRSDDELKFKEYDALLEKIKKDVWKE